MLRRRMFIQTFMLFSSIVPLFAANEYHKHRSAEVESAIKRYSRDANLEIGEIKTKQFQRTSAGKHSLVNASETTNLKYVSND